MASRAGQSVVRIVDVHPDLLGTYGDGGNAVVLAQRLRWRGYPAEVLRALSSDPLPASADLYCLGGGEDGPQARSAARLAADGSLARAVAGGAAVLAVCAGFQVVGESFPGSDGAPRAGLGLLDVRTTKGAGRRAVGELVVEPTVALDATGPPGLLPVLTGYENHGGVTVRGPGATPLGRVVAGVGNGAGDRTDGAVSMPGAGGGGPMPGAGGGGPSSTGGVIGTYLHGPVLVRNPALADLLLAWALGDLAGAAGGDMALPGPPGPLDASGRSGPPAALAGRGPLAPLDDAEVDQLRAERLAAARAGISTRGWAGWSSRPGRRRRSGRRWA